MSLTDLSQQEAATPRQMPQNLFEVGVRNGDFVLSEIDFGDGPIGFQIDVKKRPITGDEIRDLLTLLDGRLEVINQKRAELNPDLEPLAKFAIIADVSTVPVGRIASGAWDSAQAALSHPSFPKIGDVAVVLPSSDNLKIQDFARGAFNLVNNIGINIRSYITIEEAMQSIAQSR
jgi:hypothetical protein